MRLQGGRRLGCFEHRSRLELVIGGHDMMFLGEAKNEHRPRS